MLSEKRVLIARYSYRKDSQPHMVALLPKQGPTFASCRICLDLNTYFTMNHLPSYQWGAWC